MLTARIRRIFTLDGSLPAGLTFSRDKMKITGKPEQTGTYTLRFMLSNPVGEDVRTFTLKVDAELPKISPATLKNGTTGKKYSAAIKTKGSKPITLSMSGSLPAGLTFNAGTGIIAGTPTEECNNLPITITASNVGGDTEKIYYLTIKGSAPKITTKKLPDGALGSTYTAQLEATGTTPITWSASGLPEGLSMTDGTISGTPKRANHRRHATDPPITQRIM